MNNLNLTQAILSSWLSGANNGANFKRKKINYSIATCPDSQVCLKEIVPSSYMRDPILYMTNEGLDGDAIISHSVVLK